MIQIKQNSIALYDINGFTFSESEMGDSTISLKLSIPVKKEIVDGVLVDTLRPSFDKLWYVEYKGEKFYLTTTKPEGVKSISALSYEYSLVFDSRRAELKRRLVRDLASLGNDTYISQGQIFKLDTTINLFVQLLQVNLTDSFGKITVNGASVPLWVVDLNSTVADKPDRVMLEISNTFIWDLLLKTYELFGIRWKIECVSGQMIIRMGYEGAEIPHIFKYGDTTGLTKITRAVDSNKTINRLRGTGGTRNMPMNYFSNRYPAFPPEDADCILSDLANIKNLMPKCFRDSVKLGGSLIDYVQDSNLILQNGIIEDGLEPNEAIYPSIEGATVNGLFRIDEIVAVEAITIDNPSDTVAAITTVGITSKATVPEYIVGVSTTGSRPPTTISNTKTLDSFTEEFTASVTYISAKFNLSFLDIFENSFMPITTYSFKTIAEQKDVTLTGTPTVLSAVVSLVRVDTNEVVYTKSYTKADINKTFDIYFTDLVVSKKYKFKVTTTATGIITSSYVTNRGAYKWSAIGKLYDISNSDGQFKPSFDIWVKDIQFDLNETNTDGTLKYAGTENAVISFTSGTLSGNEFEIVKMGNGFACVDDTTRSIVEQHIEVEGETSHSVSYTIPSKYRITLKKSDANFQAGGNMLPNKAEYAIPSDRFVILNIQMPHSYVLTAEERLQQYLTDQLSIMKKEYPAYTIELLDSFIQEDIDYVAVNGGVSIASLLRSGNRLRVQDDRLTVGDVNLYINTVIIDEKGLLPKYTVTVTDKITVGGSTVQRLQAQIDTLSTGQYTSGQSTELSILNLDNRYLRKTIEDVAYEPITFKKATTISTLQTDDFNQGQFMGSGLGIFKDLDGATMLEVDKLSVRQKAYFNEVIINQIKFQGGIVIYSCANMEVSKFEYQATPNIYRMFFDMKGGAIQNQFVVGDQIRCQRFANGNETKYYMSVVIGVGADFIDIDPTVKAGTIEIAIGDQIVQFGSRTEPLRQSLIEVNVVQGGRQTFYEGVDSFVLTDKNVIDIGNVLDTTGHFGDTKWRTLMRVYGDMYIGTRPEELVQSYIKYNKADKELEIRGKVTFKSANGDYTDLDGAFADYSLHIEYSVDGSAGSWHSVFDTATDFYMRQKIGDNGTWGNAIRISALDGANGANGLNGINGANGNDGLPIVWKGDLSSAPINAIKNWVYRRTTDKIVYIFNGTEWVKMIADGNDGTAGAAGINGLSVYITYNDNATNTKPSLPTGDGTTASWHTNPTYATNWMSQKVSLSADAGIWGEAILINGGRKFTAQPVPPYAVGDLWFGGTTGDLKICITARETGVYVATDWVLATKYTDDSAEIGGDNLIHNSYINAETSDYGNFGRTVKVVAGVEYVFSAEASVDSAGINNHKDCYILLYSSDWVRQHILIFSSSSRKQKSIVFTAELTETLSVHSYLYPNDTDNPRIGKIHVYNYMLQEGNRCTKWKDSLKYLTDSLKGNTVVDGGLTLGNVMAVRDLVGNITAGMNGLSTPNETDFRFWAGSANPLYANFSVDEFGNLGAKSGKIAGMTIKNDSLFSQNGSEKVEFTRDLIPNLASYNFDTFNSVSLLSASDSKTGDNVSLECISSTTSFNLKWGTIIQIGALIEISTNVGGASIYNKYLDVIIYESGNETNVIYTELGSAFTDGYSKTLDLTTGDYANKNYILKLTVRASVSGLLGGNATLNVLAGGVSWTYTYQNTILGRDGLSTVKDKNNYFILSQKDIDYLLRVKGNTFMQSPNGTSSIKITDAGVEMHYGNTGIRIGSDGVKKWLPAAVGRAEGWYGDNFLGNGLRDGNIVSTGEGDWTVKINPATGEMFWM